MELACWLACGRSWTRQGAASHDAPTRLASMWQQDHPVDDGHAQTPKSALSSLIFLFRHDEDVRYGKRGNFLIRWTGGYRNSKCGKGMNSLNNGLQAFGVWARQQPGGGCDRLDSVG